MTSPTEPTPETSPPKTAELSDIANKLVRDEIEEYIEREDERQFAETFSHPSKAEHS